MIAFLEGMTFGTWLILSAILIILEILVPGTFLLWMGIAAAVVGGLLWIWPDLAWQAQLLIFPILSVITILSWRAYLKKNPQISESPSLNLRGFHYVGRVFTLDEAMVNGTGKVRIEDTLWQVTGEDFPAGTRIKITGVQGVVLTADRAEDR